MIVPDGKDRHARSDDDKLGGFGMIHFDHPALRQQKPTALVMYGIMAMRCQKEPDPEHPDRPSTWVHAGIKTFRGRFSENTVTEGLKALAESGAILKHRGPNRFKGWETEYTMPLVGAQLLHQTLPSNSAVKIAHDSASENAVKQPRKSRSNQPRNLRTYKNPRDNNPETNNPPAKNSSSGARSDERARRSRPRSAVYIALEAAQNAGQLPNHGLAHTAGIANAIADAYGDDTQSITAVINDAITNLDGYHEKRHVDQAFADALGLSSTELGRRPNTTKRGRLTADAGDAVVRRSGPGQKWRARMDAYQPEPPLLHPVGSPDYPMTPWSSSCEPSWPWRRPSLA